MHMREVLRSNNPVLLSFVEVLLRDAGLQPLIADDNMSVLEGSIGILPRRILVSAEELAQARRVMEEAGLGHWIQSDETG
jgi:hypothetical protein